MYSGSKGVPNIERDRSYLHSSLDTNPKQDKRKTYQGREELAHGYLNASVGQDDHALNTLTEAYGNSPPSKKRYDEVMDEEDRFLYGDGASEMRVKRRYSPDRERRNDSRDRMTSSNRKRSPGPYPRMSASNRLSPERPKKPILKTSTKSISPEPKAKESEQDPSNITPGGFDSKALKNVLKAIGFDFELSKQSLEKAAQDHPLAGILKAQEAASKKQKKAKPEKEPPKEAPPVSTPVAQVNTPTQPPTMPGYQPANPGLPMPVYGTEYQLQAGQFQGTQYVAPQVLPAQTGGGVYIYQPQVSGPPQLVYQQHPITSDALSMYSNVQPTTTSTNLKVITPLKTEAKCDKTAEEERRARKQRLKYLEIELDKLKRQQLQLVKKKQRQAGIGDQELLRQNSLLQAS